MTPLLIELDATLPTQGESTTQAPGGEGSTGAPGGDPGGGAPQGSPFSSMLLPLVLIFAIFYFVMIGPERKQRKRREQMLGALKKGDKVVTTGGMFATVAAVQEDVVTLAVADGVRVRFNRQAVQAVIDESAESDAKAAAG